MSNDFEKVPDIVWQLFLEIMWASPGPGHPCELLNERERFNARAIAWGWDPPLIEVGTLTELTPHGLAYTAWKDIQPKQKRIGRPKKDQKSSDTKIIAALCGWHGYEQGGSVEKYDPAKLKDIAQLADLSEKAVSKFFKDRYKDKKGYDQACTNQQIGFDLAKWQGELPQEFLQRMVDREVEDRRRREESIE